jgi:hypothetical protein
MPRRARGGGRRRSEAVGEPVTRGIDESIPLTERAEYGGALPAVIRGFGLPLSGCARTRTNRSTRGRHGGAGPIRASSRGMARTRRHASSSAPALPEAQGPFSIRAAAAATGSSYGLSRTVVAATYVRAGPAPRRLGRHRPGRSGRAMSRRPSAAGSRPPDVGRFSSLPLGRCSRPAAVERSDEARGGGEPERVLE